MRDAVEAQFFLDYRTGRVWHKEQVHQMPCCALVQLKAALVFTAFAHLDFNCQYDHNKSKCLCRLCSLGSYLRVLAFQGRFACKVHRHVRITDSRPCVTKMILLSFCFVHVSCKDAQHLAPSAEVIMPVQVFLMQYRRFGVDAVPQQTQTKNAAQHTHSNLSSLAV